MLVVVNDYSSLFLEEIYDFLKNLALITCSLSLAWNQSQMSKINRLPPLLKLKNMAIFLCPSGNSGKQIFEPGNPQPMSVILSRSYLLTLNPTTAASKGNAGPI